MATAVSRKGTFVLSEYVWYACSFSLFVEIAWKALVNYFPISALESAVAKEAKPLVYQIDVLS